MGGCVVSPAAGVRPGSTSSAASKGAAAGTSPPAAGPAPGTTTTAVKCGQCLITLQLQCAGFGTLEFTCPQCNSKNQIKRGPPQVQVRCGGPCEKIIQVQPEGLGTIEFTCPYCSTRNQVVYHGEMTDEERTKVVLPAWWKVQPAFGQSELASVSNKEVKLIQKLLDDTWKPIKTRDRKGGGKPPRLQVVQVQQNCNPKLWQNYVGARKLVAAKISSAQRYTAATTGALSDGVGRDLLGPLEEDVNEFFLFHGTKPSACASICQSDFMVKMAGSHVGTLYGPGIYFGENSSKSDEYAADDPTGVYGGLYAMLICRVTCGRMLYTDEVTPEVSGLVRKCTETKEYDSILGDREKARGTYREFIIFSNDQAYPAYVVIYRRVEED